MTRFSKINIKTVLIAAFLIIAVLAIGAAVKKAAEPKNAETTDDMAAYLSSLGWSAELPPKSEKDVIIPIKFSEVYEQYNALQKKQGFDLSKYKGETVKSYAFKITNFTAADGDVYANLLIFDGRIIGGDLSSYALGGFMVGLNGKEQAF